MIVLYSLCFTYFLTKGLAHVDFQYTVRKEDHDHRSNREAFCGGDIDVTNSSAQIQLPTEMNNGSNLYRANEDCTWHVTTLPNHYMIMKSEYFSLEKSKECVWDYVEITESKDVGVISRLCGSDPVTYITAGNELTLRFKSDSTVQDKGFSFSLQSKQSGDPLTTLCSDSVQGVQPLYASILLIEFKNLLQLKGERFTIKNSFVEDSTTSQLTSLTTTSPVGGDNDCSGIFKGIDTENGELIYTAPEYENNKECIIVVRNVMLPGFVVQIKFLYFDIEDSYNCMFDSLKIMSGERKDSVMLGGPYCGVSLQDRTFVTSGNSLRLEFRTDISIALRGFKAKISFVPSSECVCEKYQICIRQSYENRCIRGSYCVANRCQNGGTCIKTGSMEKCYCRAGFQGENCAKNDGEQFYNLRFTKAPVDRLLKRDGSHEEECAVEVAVGEQVQYEWTLNGVLVEPYNKSSGFGAHPGGVLQIDKFTDHLEGQYSCVATTSAGTAEHTFEYRLVEDCDVRIFAGPQTESKKVNEKALMICRVDSRAKTVRWKKDGVYIDFDKNSRYKQMVNNYLYIMDVGLSDAGKYTCVAEDTHGCYSSKEGKLTVIDVKPLHKYCGISIHDDLAIQARISKGNEARPNENPWHVTFTAKNHGAFCGGTLISQKFVLTSATCIKEFETYLKLPWTPENVDILLGTINCYEQGIETIRTFKSYMVHPDYNKAAPYDSDIALVELDSPVDYTDAIRPICLETAKYNDRVFLENSDSLLPTVGKVTGCGKKSDRESSPSNLQEVFLPYVFRDECEKSLSKTRHSLTDRMFCAGRNIKRTGDTCKGDMGGGYVMKTSTRWVQTGIVSWGVGKCDSIYYGVYTNVGIFYDWIEGIAKLSEEEVPNFFETF